MAESAVTFLLNKLAIIQQQEEETLLKGFCGEMVWIRDELELMRPFLRAADFLEDDDEDLKVWVKQVRYAAHDAEDVLDELNLHLENLEIGYEIESIKSRIEEISKGFTKYRFKLEVEPNNNSGNIDWHHRRGDALLIGEAELVGIEEPKRQLVGLLLEGDARLCVVSVVGMGGLGKTTLIKKVYDEAQVKNHFQSHAWINVSQSFNLEELLKDITRQLLQEMKQPVPGAVETMNRDQLKATINELLKERRYVVVLDDVWNVNDWEGLMYALPNNNSGSRVMLTTRVAEVASRSSIESHGHVYNLKPLSSKESWALFCRKTFQTDSCPSHLIKMCETILKRCEGLPLAIVAISGVLSTKDSYNIHEWEMIQRSLVVELESNDGFKSMRKILSLGFDDLPYYLKSCFLYLSVFPEDYLMERMRLIRLWIAEGLIEQKQGMTKEEVADGYLNELFNRSMIQVADVTIDGRVKTCRIHDLIREIILSKSKDQIYVAANAPNSRLPERMRRISIHNTVTDIQQIKSSASRLRSLFVFGRVDVLSILSMSSFSGMDLKLLNVLDLTGAPLEIFPEDIVQLINLRYLSLRDTKIRNLPNSIGKLRNLETLDLKRSYITELPVEILKLKRLRHLLLYSYHKPPFYPFPAVYGFKAPSGIGELSSLQKLNSIEANPCSGSSLVKEIEGLTQLRRLGITKLKREDGEYLCSSIEKLCNLHSLTLQSAQEDEILDLQYMSSPPQYLRVIWLIGRLEMLPHWISYAHHSLVKVNLRFSQLKEDPLESLGDLPNLLFLDLSSAYDGHALCFMSRGFQRLKVLHLNMLKELRTVRVEVGAMPKLEKFYITRCKLLECVPSGIVSLANLNVLQFWDVSHKLIQTLNPNQEGSAYSIIAHISVVDILHTTEDGKLKLYDIFGNLRDDFDFVGKLFYVPGVCTP